MTTNKVVAYRRKREGRTNYKKRLVYLKSRKPRLVIRKTNKQLILQITEYQPDGDKVLCAVTSKSLSKYGWKYSYNNLPACYLAGVLLAKKAKTVKVSESITDLGFQTNAAGSRVFAAIKGAIDGGLNVPADEESFPSEDRLKGAHISSYFGSTEDKIQFSKYKTDKADASKMSDDVEAVKKKIMNS
ncbi:50S ribosomal protein L18 [Candidatus Woesearchaeota archaeon]|nr:50S ribosomal protein L18 [Candidatus Woesearchaeota archaeon]